MVGLGETWIAAFALALGFSDVWAGLLTTFPLLIGGHLQLIAPFMVRWLGSRRRAAAGSAFLQAISLVPLVAGAAAGSLPGWLLLASASLYWGAGLGTGTVWNAWMTQVVPRRVRDRFFARRTGATQLGITLGLVGGGLGLHAADTRGLELTGFLVLFGVATVCRLVSVVFLMRTGERIPQHRRDRIVAGRELLHRVRHGRDGRLILFVVLMTGSVGLASPFFTPFMLGPLGFSYRAYMALIAGSFLAKALMLTVLGSWARRYGAGVLLRGGAVCIAAVPVFWILHDGFAYLFVLQMLSGMAWATYEFGAFLLYLDDMEEDERTSLLTTLNLASAVALVGGSLLGGTLLAGGGASVPSYHLVFGVSAGARAASLLLLLGLATGRPVAVPRVLFRALSVRPGMGGVLRPLWVTLRSRRRRDGRLDSPSGDPRDPGSR